MRLNWPNSKTRVVAKVCLSALSLILISIASVQAGGGGGAPASGSLDKTFDGDGIVIGPAGNANDVVIQADGQILAAGASSGGFTLVRHNPDGSPDASFGTDGVVTTSIGDFVASIRSVAVQSDDGKIVAGGQAYFSSPIGGASGSHFALARYDATGDLDPSFGSGGIVTTRLSTYGDDRIVDLVLQADGKIVLTGSAATRFDTKRAPNFYDYQFATARFHSDGTLDTAFGKDGKVITQVGPTRKLYEDDYAMAITLQADGKIVAAGRTDTGDGTRFGLVRYHP